MNPIYIYIYIGNKTFIQKTEHVHNGENSEQETNTTSSIT